MIKRRCPAIPDSNADNNAVRIEVTWRPRNSWRALRLLRRVAAFVAHAEGFTHGQLSIVVVGATAMATLHRRYLNLPGPTDVLAFDLGSDRTGGYLDGEVIVCADAARQRAAARGRSLQGARAELALYVVHGILHLAGFSDDTPAGFHQMHAREDQLLRKLGLGSVFAGGV